LIFDRKAAPNGAPSMSPKHPRFARVFLFSGLIGLGLAFAGHKSHRPGPVRKNPSAEARPFQNLSSSPEDLAKRAIACLNRGDTAAFYRLAIGREEYLQLYPFLPDADTSSPDDKNFRMGYFLMDNRKQVLRIFERYGNAGLVFSRLAFLEEMDDRKRFAFHHGFHVWVKKDTTEMELTLSKTLVSVKGGWKIWGFSDD